MKTLVLVALCAVALSCATSRTPVDTLGAATAQDAWRALTEARETFRGARSFVTVRPEGGRRFDAILELDPAGRVSLSGLSPLGTTLFRLYGDGTRVLFLDERNRRYWQGSFRDFAERTGLFRGVPIEAPADLALLLIGLPVEPAEWQGDWTRGSDGLAYRVVRGGIAEVRPPGGGSRIVFDPPVHPPGVVRVEGESGSVAVAHRELVMGETVVDVPEPPAGWSCCHLPAAVAGEDSR